MTGYADFTPAVRDTYAVAGHDEAREGIPGRLPRRRGVQHPLGYLRRHRPAVVLPADRATAEQYSSDVRHSRHGARPVRDSLPRRGSPPGPGLAGGRCRAHRQGPRPARPGVADPHRHLAARHHHPRLDQRPHLVDTVCLLPTRCLALPVGEQPPPRMLAALPAHPARRHWSRSA
jgi:hypothetical protein